MNKHRAKYFDSNFHMDPFGENGCLFSWTFSILQWKSDQITNIFIPREVAKSITVSKHHLKDSPTSKEPWSDDNHIGLMCINRIMQKTDSFFHRDFWDYDDRFFYKYWWRRWQPKHFIFFLYSCRWTRVLSLPFLWIMSLWFVGTCLNTKKTGNVLDTDGKILVFLILSTHPEFRLTTKMCNWAIKKNKLAGSWKKLFQIYYRDPKHPNRNMPKEAYVLKVKRWGFHRR